MKYLARTHQTSDKVQTIIEHATNVANLAKTNGHTWGGDFAYACGLAHDIGKYSEEFQKRIGGGSLKVDHATAGGQFFAQKYDTIGLFAAYIIMGHHGGLPNGGSQTQSTQDEPTLHGRLKRAIPDYSKFQNELSIPKLVSPTICKNKFDVSFFIRMIFSALVDADWTDAETFANDGVKSRGGFSTMSELNEKLSKHIERFINPDTTPSELNQKRTDLLKNCLDVAESSAGMFTLTAPTGSGKTISSLAFALKHAKLQDKRRVIYVAPYNTIIDQNVAEYAKILGEENVLCHSGNTMYENQDEVDENKRNSIENWNFPVIATSNVQFFESLFSNKTGKCRKLHNIAGSVIIFDEAQMIPLPYLLPCIKAIKTLADGYGCTIVLSTATQSSLDEYFDNQITKIVKDPIELHNFFRRTNFMHLEQPLSDDELAETMLSHKQVLCIVNTRRQAQQIYEIISSRQSSSVFHLSTTMHQKHRKEVLAEIRNRLTSEEKCVVISTSLVEAGVDFDFEVVYRQEAGLDSIIQAAGRCNREGKRERCASNVYVFKSGEHKSPRLIEPNITAFKQISKRHEDIASLEAIKEYFEQLYYNIGDGRLDAKNILEMLEKNFPSIPFADVNNAFKIIDGSTQQTVYCLFDVPDLEAQLRSGIRNRELFRKIAEYGVNLYDSDIKKLNEIGAIDKVGFDEDILLITKAYYKDAIGVDLSPIGGQALIL